MLITPVLASSQEVVFGADSAFESSVIGDWNEPAASVPSARVDFRPALSVFGATSELRVTGRLDLQWTGSRWSADIAPLLMRLDLFPLESLKLELGLQYHQPGTSVLLSPVNYLSPVVLDIVPGGLPTTTGTAAILGATTFFGPGYLAIRVSPAPPRLEIPGIDDVALTDVPILATSDDPDLPGFTRDSFTLDETHVLSPLQRVSVVAELGLPLGPIDVTASAFHGLDRIPTVTLAADTQGPAAGRYDLAAAPQESAIDALGISAQTAVGPASFWTDFSLAFNRQFGTLNLVPGEIDGVFRNEVIRAMHAEIVAGALLWVESAGLTFLSEYRHGFIGSQRSDIVRLDFPGTLLVSAAAEPFSFPLSLTAAGLILIPDRSAVLIPSASYSSSGEITAYLQMPFVVAGSESLLSGFGSRWSITAGLSYRF